MYVIVCAAGAAPDVGRLVAAARQRDWDVHLIATPAALGFLDVGALERQVVHGPGELEPHPPGTGGRRLDSFPWHLALDRADAR